MSVRIKLRTCASKKHDDVPKEWDSRKLQNAKYSKAWRDRLQKDPIKYQEFKESEARRAREGRRNRSAAERKNDKVKNCERQRKFRAKKKSEDSEQAPAKKRKILTRNERLKKRDYDRLKKREERERMSAQKKRRIRERDAARKREKRDKKKQPMNTPPNPSCPGTTGSTGFRTKSAKRMAVSRMWKKIPADPEKFADIIMDFVVHCTPRKEAALSARGLKASRRKINFEDPCHEKLRSTIERLTKKKDTASLEKRRLIVTSLMVAKKYRMQQMLAKRFNLRPAYLSKLSNSPSREGLRRKRRSDATCMDVVNNITAYYRNPKVARELPFMKTVKKQEQRFLMEVSVQKAYELWKLENQDDHVVSFPVFSKLRPSCVLLQRKTDINQCLCEYCTGVLLKLQSLNRILNGTGNDDCMKLKVKDKYDVISLSLCPKRDNNKYHDLKCINRTCSDCGVSLLKEQFKIVIDSYGEQIVSWQKWESKAYIHDGKKKTKKVQSTMSATFKEMFDELLAETEFLAKHLFTANWQHDQYSLIREKLPNTWSVFVLDFAENYSCISQDEIQSAHWSTQQVTVHPLVCFYKCPIEGHDHTVQDALVFLSDDLGHDAHAVHHFKTLAINYLKEKRGLKLEHVVEFTDGCGTQYKSKVPFADISNSQASHGLSLERCYFGSRHGKGPSDGVSGVVKSAVRRAVVSRRVTVHSAEDMYNYCKLNMTRDSCDGQLRSFYLVERGEINRDRPITQVKSSLAGTRVLHSVRCVSPGVLDTRLYSCFCDGCMKILDGSQCSNSNYVLPWQRRTLNLSHEVVDVVQPVVAEQNTPVVAETLSDNSAKSTEQTPVPEEEIEDIWMKLTNPAVEVQLCEEDKQLEPDNVEDIAEKLISILGDPELPTDDLVKNLLEEDQGTSNEMPEVQNELQLEVMRDYAVLYTSPPKWYLGRVVKPTNDEGVCMKFLEQRGSGNDFFWPKTADVEYVNPLYIFHGPINMIGHHSFSIDQGEFKLINDKYKKIKKKTK